MISVLVPRYIFCKHSVHLSSGSLDEEEDEDGTNEGIEAMDAPGPPAPQDPPAPEDPPSPSGIGIVPDER